MSLPNLPNKINKYKSEIIELKGLNYTDMLSNGDMRNTKNITTDRYPYITTGKLDEECTEFGNVSAIASYTSPITVSDGTLKINGREMVATVGNEIVLASSHAVTMPDGIMVKLNDIYDCKRKITEYDKHSEETIQSDDAFFTWLEGIEPIGVHTFTKTTNGWIYTSDPVNEREGNIYDISDLDIADDFEEKPTKPYITYTVTLGEDVIKHTDAEMTGYGFGVSSDKKTLKLYKFGFGNAYAKVESLADGSTLTDVRPNENVIKKFANQHDLQFGQEAIRVNSQWLVRISSTTRYYLPDTFIYYNGQPENGDIISIGVKRINPKDVFSINDILMPFGKTITGFGEDGDYYTITFSEAIEKPQETRLKLYTSARDMKDFDCCCESNNRLWACSNKTHTIYASALGKPYDFTSDMGLSVGAYQVTTGSAYEFTGCYAYGSSVLFFTENMIYKVMGDSPKNYQMYSYHFDGVKKGCNKSLCLINEVLYYVGKNGVYAYSGGYPTLISAKLGNIKMEGAVGGSDGFKYYLSCLVDGEKRLYIYDTRYNIWLLKDNAKAIGFANGDDGFYMLSDLGKVYKVGTHELTANDDWHIEFAPMYESIEGKKVYSKIMLRLELPKGSYITAKIRRDGGLWQTVGTIKGSLNNTATMQIAIDRCDKFELRLEGKGKCTILSILREFGMGSDK